MLKSNFDINNKRCEKLLGVKFDQRLTFDNKISDSCKRANRKIRELARLTPYMNLSKRRFLMNTFSHYGSTISLQLGSDLFIKTIAELVDSKRAACGKYIITSSHHFNRYWKNTGPFLFTTETFKILQLKSTK